MIQGQGMPGSPEHFPKSATRFSDEKCDKTKNSCEVNPDSRGSAAGTHRADSARQQCLGL